MPGSAPRTKPGAPGFTLIEVVVVLAIIGLLLALIPGFLVRGQPGLDVDVAARAIADGLRQTRSQAMLANREQVFTIDVEAGRFRASTSRAPTQLDRAIELELFTARSELVETNQGRIRFFPDGSSTGGRIALTMDGGASAVSVDWLTGQVEIGRAGP